MDGGPDSDRISITRPFAGKWGPNPAGLLALLQRRSIPGGSRLSRGARLLREISLLEITMQLRRDQRARNRFPNQAFSNRWVLEIEDVVTLFCGYVLFVNFYPKRELR